MASAFSRFRDEDDLQAQVAHLTREMSALKKAFSRRGSETYGDVRESAADFYSDLHERFSDALPTMRKQARAAGEVTREHPATAAVAGLMVVGLLVTLLTRGSGAASSISRRSKR